MRMSAHWSAPGQWKFVSTLLWGAEREAMQFSWQPQAASSSNGFGRHPSQAWQTVVWRQGILSLELNDCPIHSSPLFLLRACACARGVCVCFGGEGEGEDSSVRAYKHTLAFMCVYA